MLMGYLAPLSTLVVFTATTIVILLRLFHAQNTRQRQQLLSQVGFKSTKSKDITIAGFLHPYCNAGGGGERVLWAAVAYLQRTEPHVLSVIYTGDVDPKTQSPVKKEEILKRTKERFGITLKPDTVHFIHLRRRWLIEDRTWKRFTMLGQGIGTALLAVEAMSNLMPDIFIDTLGLAFSYPVVRFLSFGTTSAKKLPIVAYIHYPTISASMLRRVSARETTYANDSSVTGSGWKSRAKLIYYRTFSWIYTSCLLTSQPLILSVNGSWTYAHVVALLSTRITSLPSVISAPVSLIATLLGYNMPAPYRINQPPSTDSKVRDAAPNVSITPVRKIYPPCDVEPLEKFSLDGRKRIIFSCAQFRPEKDHAKQLNAFALLLKAHPELFISQQRVNDSPTKEKSSEWLDSNTNRESKNDENAGYDGVKLVLLGSARHREDLDRVQELRDLAARLEIESYVEFRLNAPYEELLHWLSVSSIGISTMVEEHFGIGVVEFMGAGLIPVVHSSGGPIMDLVIPVDGEPTGYLADSAEEFASQLYAALSIGAEEALGMRERARKSSRRFSTESFEQGFQALWEDVKSRLQ